jgi:hypothetical protein
LFYLLTWKEAKKNANEQLTKESTARSALHLLLRSKLIATGDIKSSVKVVLNLMMTLVGITFL